MKIGIFGGSFNPIHKGHINIAMSAIDELGLDKLIFVPANQTPFKSKLKYLSANHRVNMIELVKPPKSEVSLFEINRKGISYSIDTVKYFKQKYPNEELFLIIGSDNVSKLHKWKLIEEISKLVNITVFKREGTYSKINIKRFQAQVLNNEIWPESSSDVRKGQFGHLNKKVHEYISKENLLLLEMGRNTLSARRHKHCIAAASMAADLAKLNKVDAKQAWIAGLMHDITKEWSNEKHRKFLLKHGWDPLGTPELIWHQWTGALWMKEIYGIKNQEVVDAIFKHSNADAMPFKDLTTMDKIVYVADKLCDGRKYPGIQKHREIARKNLDEGFKLAAETSIKLIKEKYGSINFFKLKKVGK